MLVDNIEVRQPSLDDVFFSLTGGHIEEGGRRGRRDGARAWRSAATVLTARRLGRRCDALAPHELEGARV